MCLYKYTLTNYRKRNEMKYIIHLLLLALSTTAFSQLKIVHPNGGEKLQAGSEVNIYWEGIFWQEYINLEFSSNVGRSWQKIDTNLQYLYYKWKVPYIICDSILVRVTQISDMDYNPIVNWSKSYGGSNEDNLNSMESTTDGGYIVAGSTYSEDGDIISKNGGLEGLIIKLNSMGEIEWSRTFGDTRADSFNSIKQTHDRGYIASGVFNNTSSPMEHPQLWTLKLDSSGIVEWESALDLGDYGGSSSVMETIDSNYIMVGSGYTIGRFDSLKMWVAKKNSKGKTLWSKFYGGSKNDIGITSIETKEGDYIIVGKSSSVDGDLYGKKLGYTWLLKLDQNGNIIWSKYFGGTRTDYISSIITTIDGGFLAVGSSNSRESVSSNRDMDLWILKFNSEFSIEWEKKIGNSKEEEAISVLQTSNGDYLIASKSNGKFKDNSKVIGSSDFWVIKITSTGLILWSAYYGGANSDIPKKIIQTRDGGFLVGGTITTDSVNIPSSKGEKDFWIIKLLNDSNLYNIATSDSLFSILEPQTSILDSEVNIQFTIHPNIATSTANVTLELTEIGVTSLELFDSQGTRLDILLSGYQTIGLKELQIDVSQYPSGRYFLKLTTPTISKTEIIEVVR